MSPNYHAGDYVVLSKSRRALGALKPGDVIASHQIAYGVMVKRVQEVEAGSGLVTVVGDNPDFSTDSRRFGPIHTSDIIGKVVWHIGRDDR